MNTPFLLPCGVELPNRICKPAMSEQLAYRSGCPTPQIIHLYERWGKEGGAGLLITGNIMVHPYRLTEPRNCILIDDRFLSEFSQMAKVAKANGSKVIAQISHPGRVATMPMLTPPVGPSSIPLDIPILKFRKPRALEISEIEEIIQSFARTAELCMRAGFDGVQIHAAHGYLVSQFLSPKSNTRNDAYGGDAERRRKLILDIVKETRMKIGANAILSVKLNSADMQKGGFTEEESLGVIPLLEKAGVDLLEISGGNYESPSMVGTIKPSSQKREAYFLEFASKVRNISNIPLMLTGGIRTPEFGNQVIESKEVDILGIARPFAIAADAGTRLLRGQPLTDLATLRKTGIPLIDAFLQISFSQLCLIELSEGKKVEGKEYSAVVVLIRVVLGLNVKVLTQYPENDWKWISIIGIIFILVFRRIF